LVKPHPKLLILLGKKHDKSIFAQKTTTSNSRYTNVWKACGTVENFEDIRVARQPLFGINVIRSKNQSQIDFETD